MSKKSSENKKNDAVVYERVPDKRSRKFALALVGTLLFCLLLAIVSAFLAVGVAESVFVVIASLLFVFFVMVLPICIFLFFKKTYAQDTKFDERSGPGGTITPDEIKKWNWAAAFLSIFWGIYFNVWLVFLSFIPIVSYFVWIWLGIKGNKLAWRAQKWPSVEEFNRVQNKWKPWGIAVFILLICVSTLSFFVIVIENRYSLGNPQSQESFLSGKAREDYLWLVIPDIYEVVDKKGIEPALDYLDQKKDSLDGRSDFAFILDGVGFILQEDYEQMDNFFQKAVGASDGSVDYRFLASIIRNHQRMDLFPKELNLYSIKYLEKHIEAYPDDIMSYVDLARIYIRDTHEPQKALEYMILIENSDVSEFSYYEQSEFYWALCRSYLDTDQMDMALKRCLYVAKEFPEHSSINNLGFVHEKLGNYKAALEMYGRAIDLLPSSELYKNNYDRVKRKLDGNIPT